MKYLLILLISIFLYGCADPVECLVLGRTDELAQD